MEAAHRDTGRTRNTACGWYVISSAVSTDTWRHMQRANWLLWCLRLRITAQCRLHTRRRAQAKHECMLN